MSSIISFTTKELKKLVADKKSCVEEKRVTQEIALQPWCLANVPGAIKKNLDYKVGKFDKELDGILLSYKNLQMMQEFGAVRNDKADIYFKIQADYYIFRPHVGAVLKGIVNKKSSQHLGILVHRVFNVVIPWPTEYPGNNWIGSRIKEGQKVVFKIVVLDLFGALPYIRGELVERYLKVDDEEQIEDVFFESVSNVSHVNFDMIKPKSQRKESCDKVIDKVEPDGEDSEKATGSNIDTSDCSSSEIKTPKSRKRPKQTGAELKEKCGESGTKRKKIKDR